MTAAGKRDHVAILVHRHGWFEGSNYWLRAIAEAWAESNIRVSVVNNPTVAVEADLAVLHVDLTVIPGEYLAGARRFPVTANGGVHDISKRAISANLLTRGDRYDGPVIVKTDRTGVIVEVGDNITTPGDGGVGVFADRRARRSAAQPDERAGSAKARPAGRLGRALPYTARGAHVAHLPAPIRHERSSQPTGLSRRLP